MTEAAPARSSSKPKGVFDMFEDVLEDVIILFDLPAPIVTVTDTLVL